MPAQRLTVITYGERLVALLTKLDAAAAGAKRLDSRAAMLLHAAVVGR